MLVVLVGSKPVKPIPGFTEVTEENYRDVPGWKYLVTDGDFSEGFRVTVENEDYEKTEGFCPFRIQMGLEKYFPLGITFQGHTYVMPIKSHPLGKICLTHEDKLVLVSGSFQDPRVIKNEDILGVLDAVRISGNSKD